MDTAQQLKDLAAAEKKAKLIELNQLQAEALTQLGRQEATIKPEFAKQRQTASVQSQLGAKNFAEFMAQRGQTQAGISQASELSRQNVLGRNLGDIQTAETGALNKIGEARTDIGSQYTRDLTGAYGSIDADLRKNLYNEMMRKQEQAREDAQRKQSFNQEVYLRNLSNQRNVRDNTGKINKLQGTTLDRNAVLGMKGVPDSTGKKMIWSIPQSDGSITQVSFAKGVNPFTGSTNSSLYTIDKRTGKKVLDTTRAMSNGYQPKYVKITTKVQDKGNKLNPFDNKKVNKKVEVAVKPTGKKTTMFGIEQEVYKVAPNYYMVWDGANNKYIRV